MRYDSFSYLWPPRPDQPIPQSSLPYYEISLGYVAQAKKNGTCNIIAVKPSLLRLKKDRRGFPEDEWPPAEWIVCMNRHKEDHKLWQPTAASSEIFKNLPGDGWYVFVAELLHSKLKEGPKDTNFINDILVADGEYLVGKTFGERQYMLYDLFLGEEAAENLSLDDPSLKGRDLLNRNNAIMNLRKRGITEAPTHYVLNRNTWLAKNFASGFSKLYKSFTTLEDEGLVLKDPDAKLTACTRESSNSGWQVKCRRQIGQGGKNYSY
jgi:hypothetical protein